MDRREVLKLLASAAALPALSSQAFSLFRDLHAQIAEMPGRLKTLSPHQNETVIAIAELIIPQTDTPGAKAVKVNEFIDLILSDWYDGDDTARFLSGLDGVDERSRDLFGSKFIACSAEQQNQILRQLDEESVISMAKYGVPTGTKLDNLANPPSFFLMMKKLTLIGYYTSEVGFEQELHRSIIPPGHAGCAPIPKDLAS
jgi:glucoside 3-dehydrogenase (cytochrome c) hitch-hiker subunit